MDFSSRLTHYVAVILYYAFKTSPLLNQHRHLLLLLRHAIEAGFTSAGPEVIVIGGTSMNAA